MNLSPLWAEFLSAGGFESVHWSSVGDARAPDSEIMDYASANDFIVFTHDLDFGALLAERRTRRPSVIQVRTQDVLPAAIGERVLSALRLTARQLEVGALVTVDLARNRMRLLPL